MRSRFLHRFGRGIGFGAELLDLSWSYFYATANRLSFAMHTDSPPRGVAVCQGWSDYFNPFCPNISLGSYSVLNQHFEFRKQYLLHHPCRLLLDSRLRRRFHYMFDRQALAKRWLSQGPCAMGIDRGSLLRSIYRLNPQTIDFLVAHTAYPRLAAIQIAVHLRRGDKISEAPYASLSGYARAIQAIPDWDTKGLYIMSDSSSARRDLLSSLGVGQLHDLSAPAVDVNGNGYDQKSFNQKLPAERRIETLRLLADIEIARHAQYFIGTSTSNLYHLIGLLRGDDKEAMISVE